MRMGLLAAVIAFALTGPGMALPQLLVDMHTGEVLYEQDAGQPWHPASLTKLMTAYVTFEAIAQGRVTLDTPVSMSANALKEPPSKIGAPVGTAYRLEDALYLLIVKSANDIAVAIAETVSGSEPKFIEEMNQTAAELGLSATHYVNPNGLDDPAQVTSARDLAVLTLFIKQRFPQYQRMFATHEVLLGKARLKSQNDLLVSFAGTTGMKTGYVCASGLNIVATAERGGRQLMAVVLGGSSGRERGELTAQLFLRGFSGAAARTGKSVSQVANLNTEAVNMRPYICGKEAKEYVAKRVADFPLGLEGEPSYLTDEILPVSYQAHSLGQLRIVPLPRPRPLWAPAPRALITPVLEADESEAETVRDAPLLVPLPRPRPAFRLALRPGN